MASQAEVDLVISTADALPELERELGQIITAAEASADPVELQAALDSRDALVTITSELTNVINSVEANLSEVEIEAALNTLETLENLTTDLENAIDIATANVGAIQLEAELDADIAELDAEIAALVEELESSAPEINLEVDVDRDRSGSGGLARLGRGLTSVLGPLAGAAGSLGKVGLAAGAAAPLLAGVATAIGQVAPAAALAVSGLLTLQLATQTVKLAMIGVGDAVKTAFDPEAKPEDLAKAMAKLSPAARSFVTELRGMRKGFKEIQQGVQENFFAGFDKALQGLSKNVLPTVREALLRTSGELNGMALGAADAASELGRNGTLGRALDGSVRGLENLSKIPAQIVTGLVQIGAAAAPAFGRVTAAVARAAKSISDRLGAAFKSGALEKSISGALEAIKQLGRVFKNVFEGVGNIFRGLQGTGEGLFGVLEKVSRAFADVTATKGFQDALTALVTTSNVIVQTALPLLSQAIQALGPILQVLAEPIQTFVKALGVALSEVLPALAPLLLKLAEAFGKILEAAAPLVIQIGSLITQILTELQPIIQPTIDLIVRLVRDGFDVLAKVIPQFVIPALKALVAFLNGDFKKAFEISKGLVIDLARELTEQTFQGTENAGNGFKKLGVVVKDQTTLMKDAAIRGIASMTAEMIRLIQGLPGEISNTFRSAGDILFQVGIDIIRGLIDGIRSQIGALRKTAEDAAAAARDAVTGLLRIHSPSLVMMDVGKDTMEGFRIGLVNSLPSIRNELQGIASLVPTFALPNGQTLALPSAPSSEPVIQVYLGNELLNRHVDTRIARSNTARDRLQITGVRR